MTIRIAALTAGHNTPSTRFRIRQHIDYLKMQGVDVTEYIPIIGKDQLPVGVPSTIRMRYILPYFVFWQLLKAACRIPNVLSTYKYDITWITRSFINGLYTFEPFVKKPLVLDIDDAIWTSKPFGNSTLTKLAKAADVVVVGNEYLANWFCGKAKSIRIVPTAVNIDVFSPREYSAQQSNDTFIIGWTGSGVNLSSLYKIETALSIFMHTYPQVQLHVISDISPKFTEIPPGRVKHFSWSPDTEALILKSWDVGIMPLTDDEFSKGKCSFKMLQYMATALPVIVSPVGMNSSVLKMGDIGYAASSEKEWIETLESLLLSPKIRSIMGRTGRQIVEKNFSTETISACLANIFKELV